MTHRVVIADDDEDVRLLLKVVLGHEPDFEVVGEAATPDEALELVRREQPRAIIIDQEFRGHSNGTDVAPMLRGSCPDMSIVMFSAYDGLRSELQGSDSVDAFVLKTDIMSLPTIVRSLMNGTS
jgi:DNA-binding NarL/FixJ family response regulator